jgi:hypothetical protein|nr:MAG TPA: hypothetical protein [Caudoviricetes sp.]
MTGQEMFEKALKLLSYTEPDGSSDSSLVMRALSIINAVYADIFFIFENEGFTPLYSLSDEIGLPERVLRDVMPYGVAMHLALGEGDGLNEQVFATLYNSKRASLGPETRRGDVIPSIYE